MNFRHARENKQIEIMNRAKDNNECPFCWDNFDRYHIKPIIIKERWWLVTENDFPYGGAEIQLLFIYREHVSDISEVSNKAFKELGELVKFCRRSYNIRGGALFMRFGDTNMNGSSVEHLHAQLISGNSSCNEKDSEGLKVKLGYKK